MLEFRIDIDRFHDVLTGGSSERQRRQIVGRREDDDDDEMHGGLSPGEDQCHIDGGMFAMRAPLVAMELGFDTDYRVCSGYASVEFERKERDKVWEALAKANLSSTGVVGLRHVRHRLEYLTTGNWPKYIADVDSTEGSFSFYFGVNGSPAAAVGDKTLLGRNIGNFFHALGRIVNKLNPSPEEEVVYHVSLSIPVD